MTETRIVFVQHQQGDLFRGEAEGMEWIIVPKAFSHIQINIGDYVHCYLLHDPEKDEFYLEQIPNHEKGSKEQWEKQEEMYS